MNIFKILLLCILLLISCSSSSDSSSTEPDTQLFDPYLGQTPPGTTAKLFAPSLINTGLNVRDIAITPDGKEFYFSTNTDNHSYSTIYIIKVENDIWKEAEIAPFATQTQFRFGEPFISPDGNKMYFISTQPADGTNRANDYDIWVIDRVDSTWGEPQNLGLPINTELNEFFPSVTNSGTIYFTRTIPNEGTFIFRSKLVDGHYQEPEKLGNEINSTNDQFNAFIAPDESYIIVPNGRRSDSFGSTDYYLCNRSENDTWSEPINLGKEVNSIYAKEWSAYVSPDGKYLFFMSDRGPQNIGTSKIFWIDAGFLTELGKK